MKVATLKYGVLSALVTIITLIVVLMPFHALLTIWGSSLVGHYTALRLWKEVLFLICAIGTLYLVIFDKQIRQRTLHRRLIWLILAYSAVVLVWGAAAYAHHNVTAKALGYGLIVDLRFPLFFLICWAVGLRTSRLRGRWPKLLLWPATAVIIFGLLQILILPHNFLSHFGYGPNTIAPFETINHNSHYIRIMSTLRGANPLGAYLLVPLSALGVLIAAGRRQAKLIVLLLAGLVTMFFSFSRSAWLAALVSAAVIVLLQPKLKPWRPKILLIAAALIILLGGLAIGFRNNQHFQNIILHTQTHSAVKTTSDQGHASALRNGLHDIIHQPLGRGPGTAGPASVYNHNQARFAENFYVQIGQEVGWLGLVLFLLINIGVGYLLWLQRTEPLALALLASFIGLIVVNLLSHAWADDTLAYVWWGLAGIALAPKPKTTND